LTLDLARSALFMKALSILGSTGSIGRQTLQVVESLPERFRVVAPVSYTHLTLPTICSV